MIRIAMHCGNHRSLVQKFHGRGKAKAVPRGVVSRVPRKINNLPGFTGLSKQASNYAVCVFARVCVL
jgi:hypothetical protein